MKFLQICVKNDFCILVAKSQKKIIGEIIEIFVYSVLVACWYGLLTFTFYYHKLIFYNLMFKIIVLRLVRMPLGFRGFTVWCSRGELFLL